MATSYAYKNGNCLFVATNDDAQFPTGEEKRITIPGYFNIKTYFYKCFKTVFVMIPATLINSITKTYPFLW
jgi:hypothetical protein